jgi:peptide/nickel transport system permease protein
MFENTAKENNITIRVEAGRLARFIKVFFGRWMVIAGTVVILVFITVGIFAPFIAPNDPYAQDLTQPLSQPSSAHWLGTDTLGRDILTRIIFGTRTSLVIGLGSVSVAAFTGMAMGLIAAYFGGVTFAVVMRLVDALMAFPMLMLALAIAALLGSGMTNVIIALAVGLLPSYARIMCGQVLSVKQNEYIIAERSIGAGDVRIMMRHILPNCLPPIIVMMTMQLGMAILTEASLSFLGVGIKPPIAAWGAMVNDGYQHLITSPILSFAPGLAIMIVVFSFNMVGDGLRDVLDPRLRGVL